jgi:glycosyltransferase involved in cell wall biosynthesis
MATAPPRFSIVIPTYNRPGPLQDCLDALARLDYPAERYEIIVVDDGGDFPLDGIAAAFQGRLNLRLLRQDNAGPGAARNAGAAEARGDCLAFTDDDCRPEPGWLRAFAEAHAQRPEDLLGGRTQNGVPCNIYSAASQALQEWFYDYCESQASPLRFFASNNLSLPAALFREMGGFDTATVRYASEDRELCGRWLAWGRQLGYVPAARVWHYHRLDAPGFWRQHLAYGRGGYRLRLARAKQGLGELPKDRRWAFASLFRYPFREPPLARGMALSVLAFGTHLANLLGYVLERRGEQNRRRHPR